MKRKRSRDVDRWRTRGVIDHFDFVCSTEKPKSFKTSSKIAADLSGLILIISNTSAQDLQVPNSEHEHSLSTEQPPRFIHLFPRSFCSI